MCALCFLMTMMGAQEPSIYQTDTSNGYTAFLSGIIMSAWSLMGYDAAAHMIEETINADRAARWSFLLTAGLSFISGFFFLSGIAVCIQVAFCPIHLPDSKTLAVDHAEHFVATSLFTS